jgi:hypothetical protein
MTDIRLASTNILRDAGFELAEGDPNARLQITFEDRTVLGFLFIYPTTASLLEEYDRDSNSVVSDNQLALRRAGQKAWNTYTVFFTADHPDLQQSAGLTAIEEDLAGTRKIARAGIADNLDVRAALLPLLPLQSAPRLDAVDTAREVALRTTELGQRTIEAFLSQADESIVLSVLEEAS